MEKEVKEVKEVKEIANGFQSIDEIVSTLAKDKNNFLASREIVGIRAEYQSAKNGNTYVNVWVSLDKPIQRIEVGKDGTENIIPLSTAQMPMFSLLLPFRNHKFYRKFVDAIAAKIESEISFSDDAKTATFYFSGIPCQILGQFVAAGEAIKNPFQRNAEPYEIKAYNRFVYHLISVDLPTDEDTLEEYAELRQEMKAERRAAIEAAKVLEAKKAKLMKSFVEKIEEPF